MARPVHITAHFSLEASRRSAFFDAGRCAPESYRLVGTVRFFNIVQPTSIKSLRHHCTRTDHRDRGQHRVPAPVLHPVHVPVMLLVQAEPHKVDNTARQ